MISLEGYFELDHGLPDGSKSIRGEEAAELLFDYHRAMESGIHAEPYEYDANDFIKDVSREENLDEKSSEKGKKISELLKQKHQQERG